MEMRVVCLGFSSLSLGFTSALLQAGWLNVQFSHVIFPWFTGVIARAGSVGLAWTGPLLSWVSDRAFLPGLHLLEQSFSARSQLPEAVPLRQTTAWHCLLEQLMISNMCWLQDLQSGNSSPPGCEIIACRSARPSLSSLVCSLKHLSFDLN